MPDPRERQITFYDYLLILRKRISVVILTLLAALSFTVYYTYTSPRVYEASTTLMIEPEQSQLQALNPAQTYQTQLESQIEILKSRTLAKQVVEALHSNPHHKSLPGLEGLSPSQVQGSISARPITNTNILRLSLRANTPLTAQVLANTVARVYIDQDLQNKLSEVSKVRNFIEDQLRGVQERLRESEENLRKYKEANAAVALPAESDQIVTSLASFEAAYNQTKTDRRVAEQRLSYIQDKLSRQKKELAPSVADISSPLIERLKSKLVDLEARRSALLTQGYPEEHRAIRKLQNRISETKQSLSQEIMKVVQGEGLIDPLSQIRSLLEQSISAEVEISTFKAREKALLRTIDKYNSQLLSLPEKELVLARLSRIKQANEQTYMMLLSKLNEARIEEAGKVAGVRVIDEAEEPKSPISPRPKLNLLFGFSVGLLLGVGIAFFLEHLERGGNSLKTIEDVEGYTELPVLGSIPTIEPSNNLKGWRIDKNDSASSIVPCLVSHLGSRSPISEAYRTLRTNIQFADSERLRTMVVTSSIPREGKSITVANLAITTAQMDIKTLLIDSDLRHPTHHGLFDLEREPGLTDLLLEDIHPKDVLMPTQIENLFLMPCGRSVSNSSKLLGSERMKDLLEKLKEYFEVILLDSPPVLAVTDPAVLGAEVDGVSLVIESAKTDRDAVLRAKRLLNNVNAKLIGAILNNIDLSKVYRPYSYYYHYQYYYTYTDEEDDKGRKGLFGRRR